MKKSKVKLALLLGSVLLLGNVAYAATMEPMVEDCRGACSLVDACDHLGTNCMCIANPMGPHCGTGM